jgi:hypothetical protein
MKSFLRPKDATMTTTQSNGKLLSERIHEQLDSSLKFIGSDVIATDDEQVNHIQKIITIILNHDCSTLKTVNRATDDALITSSGQIILKINKQLIKSQLNNSQKKAVEYCIPYAYKFFVLNMHKVSNIWPWIKIALECANAYVKVTEDESIDALFAKDMLHKIVKKLGPTQYLDPIHNTNKRACIGETFKTVARLLLDEKQYNIWTKLKPQHVESFQKLSTCIVDSETHDVFNINEVYPVGKKIDLKTLENRLIKIAIKPNGDFKTKSTVYKLISNAVGGYVAMGMIIDAGNNDVEICNQPGCQVRPWVNMRENDESIGHVVNPLTLGRMQVFIKEDLMKSAKTEKEHHYEGKAASLAEMFKYIDTSCEYAIASCISIMSAQDNSKSYTFGSNFKQYIATPLKYLNYYDQYTYGLYNPSRTCEATTPGKIKVCIMRGSDKHFIDIEVFAILAKHDPLLYSKITHVLTISAKAKEFSTGKGRKKDENNNTYNIIAVPKTKMIINPIYPRVLRFWVTLGLLQVIGEEALKEFAKVGLKYATPHKNKDKNHGSKIVNNVDLDTGSYKMRYLFPCEVKHVFRKEESGAIQNATDIMGQVVKTTEKIDNSTLMKTYAKNCPPDMVDVFKHYKKLISSDNGASAVQEANEYNKQFRTKVKIFNSYEEAKSKFKSKYAVTVSETVWSKVDVAKCMDALQQVCSGPGTKEAFVQNVAVLISNMLNIPESQIIDMFRYEKSDSEKVVVVQSLAGQLLTSKIIPIPFEHGNTILYKTSPEDSSRIIPCKMPALNCNDPKLLNSINAKFQIDLNAERHYFLQTQFILSHDEPGILKPPKALMADGPSSEKLLLDFINGTDKMVACEIATNSDDETSDDDIDYTPQQKIKPLQQYKPPSKKSSNHSKLLEPQQIAMPQEDQQTNKNTIQNANELVRIQNIEEPTHIQETADDVSKSSKRKVHQSTRFQDFITDKALDTLIENHETKKHKRNCASIATSMPLRKWLDFKKAVIDKSEDIASLIYHLDGDVVIKDSDLNKFSTKLLEVKEQHIAMMHDTIGFTKGTFWEEGKADHWYVCKFKDSTDHRGVSFLMRPIVYEDDEYKPETGGTHNYVAKVISENPEKIRLLCK